MEGNKKYRPPKWADDFLKWYTTPRFLEEVQGDLYEAFYKRCKELGIRRAKLLFTTDVLRSISLRTIDNPFHPNKWSANMLNNYLKSGWRNFLKYKSYALINLFGLSIGFSSALLLFLIIRYENSFDLFHNKVNQIYRVGNSFQSGGHDDVIVTPQIPLMANEYPDIIHASRFHGDGDIIGYNNTFVRTSYRVVDSDFAYMFDFKMISGDLKKALASPNQIVLTKTTASKLFGNEDPMGKSVYLVGEKINFTVAAVAEDLPKNSTLQFEALIPWMNAPKWLDIDQAGNWYNTFMVGYVELAPTASKEALEEKLIAFKNAHFLEERKGTWSVVLLPMVEEHFRLTKNKAMITGLGIIACAILLISCINFTNLSVAQTLKRTKEIGLRRVLGSLKRHVTLQFIIESLITCTISMVIGITVTWFVVPYLNSYYDFGVTIEFQHNKLLILFIISICLLPCLFSSVGPSLALSGLKPVNAIKGTIKGNISGEYLRRVLLVLQFTASIVLLIGTAIVWQQTNYMKSQDLKFDHNNVVAVDTWPELFKDPEKAKQGFLSLRNEFENETVVEAASFASCVPGEYDENYNMFTSTDSSESKAISLRQVYVDHNFFRTFDMEIIKGRNFSPEIESDKKAIVINETALKELGWTDVENKELLEGGGGNEKFKVIGVVQDYHYQSLKRSIQPLVHFYTPENVSRLTVRLKPGRIEDGLALLKSKWDSFGSYEPFNYRFIDKSFDNLYKEQDRLSATTSLFSIIAVIIAGLGLFSITAYSVRLRRREVGIRKVLGASVPAIILKLSKMYGVMIISGFILACPIIFYLANSFLEGFAYRIQLSPVVFVSVGIGIFVFAMLIVGWLSAKAALENPVDTLKEE
jgi:putative ABC transport system permease protein